MKVDESLIKKYWKQIWIYAMFGLIVSVGITLIGIYEREINIVWPALLLLLTMIFLMNYVRRIGRCREDGKSNMEKE